MKLITFNNIYNVYLKHFFNKKISFLEIHLLSCKKIQNKLKSQKKWIKMKFMFFKLFLAGTVVLLTIQQS